MSWSNEADERMARMNRGPSPVFRVIDTGIRDGRRQISFDQAMIDAHQAGSIGDTIRFLRFPPTALVGRHQSLEREVRVDHGRANGTGLARRITGGGAIYFDPGQLGWCLVFHRSTLGIASLEELARRICEAAAAGLRRLGVDARYRPRNDIEVDGRKLGGTGGFFDGDTLFYQGTVLVDLDPRAMLDALKVPEDKLARHGLDSAAGRVVTPKALLGSAPPMAAVQEALLAGFAEGLAIAPMGGTITAEEEALALRLHDEEIGTEAFVAGPADPAAVEGLGGASATTPGGTITVHIRLEGTPPSRIREALVTGDFFVTPPRTILDLESALRGAALEDAGDTVERFFARSGVSVLSAAPADFRRTVEAAIAAARG
jgi:lipoate-protein ligase A